MIPPTFLPSGRPSVVSTNVLQIRFKYSFSLNLIFSAAITLSGLFLVVLEGVAIKLGVFREQSFVSFSRCSQYGSGE